MPEDFGAFPIRLDVFPDGYDGPAWEVEPYRQRAGWLMVSEARLSTPFAPYRRTLLACVTDAGETFSQSLASKLFAMPTSLPKLAEDHPPQALDLAMEMLFWSFLGAADINNLKGLEAAQSAADAEIEACDARCLAIEATLAAQMRALRAERRLANTEPARRDAIDAALGRLSAGIDALPVELRTRIAALRAKTDESKDAVMDGLKEPGEIDTFYVVRWIARHLAEKADIRLPIYQEEPYSAEAWRLRPPSAFVSDSMVDADIAIRARPQE